MSCLLPQAGIFQPLLSGQRYNPQDHLSTQNLDFSYDELCLTEGMKQDATINICLHLNGLGPTITPHQESPSFPLTKMKGNGSLEMKVEE